MVGWMNHALRYLLFEGWGGLIDEWMMESFSRAFTVFGFKQHVVLYAKICIYLMTCLLRGG